SQFRRDHFTETVLVGKRIVDTVAVERVEAIELCNDRMNSKTDDTILTLRPANGVPNASEQPLRVEPAERNSCSSLLHHSPVVHDQKQSLNHQREGHDEARSRELTPQNHNRPTKGGVHECRIDEINAIPLKLPQWRNSRRDEVDDAWMMRETERKSDPWPNRNCRRRHPPLARPFSQTEDGGGKDDGSGRQRQRPRVGLSEQQKVNRSPHCVARRHERRLKLAAVRNIVPCKQMLVEEPVLCDDGRGEKQQKHCGVAA